jgi:carotenoid cleavage dioxygenase-like enzyme
VPNSGFAPDFKKIPLTYLWRLEIDPKAKRTVSLDIAPGCHNICTEHMLVHPNFIAKKAQIVYGSASNIVGDSTPPNGYVKLKVETGSTKALKEGEANKDVDSYWFGTRYFTTEPIIVPKDGGDIENEDEAYLLGMVRDAANQRNFLAIFDLEKDLKEGPIAKVWLKSGIPHGIHGCFAKDSKGSPSVFC